MHLLTAEYGVPRPRALLAHKLMCSLHDQAFRHSAILCRAIVFQTVSADSVRCKICRFHFICCAVMDRPVLAENGYFG
jgi:hypothetical protein